MSNLNSKLEKYEILTMLSYNYKESIGECQSVELGGPLSLVSYNSSPLVREMQQTMLYIVLDTTQDSATFTSYDYKESIGEFLKQIEEANQIDTLALHYLDNRTRLHRHLAFQQVVENQNSNNSKKSIVTHLLILLV